MKKWIIDASALNDINELKEFAVRIRNKLLMSTNNYRSVEEVLDGIVHYSSFPCFPEKYYISTLIK